MKFRFDPGEPSATRKHAPVGPEPTYRIEAGKIVCKCPRGISTAEADELLNADSSLPVYASGDTGGVTPIAIYAVRRGVLYRAMPTGSGTGRFHGFPETAAMFERFCRTRASRSRLWTWADANGTRREIEDWFAKTETWRVE